MTSNLNPGAEAFLSNMERVQRTIAEASRQTSSGLRVNSASDAPDQIDSILQLRTDSSRNGQIQANLALAKTDADAADSAPQHGDRPLGVPVEADEIDHLQRPLS